MELSQDEPVEDKTVLNNEESLIGRWAILKTYPRPYNGWKGQILRKTNSRSFPEYAVRVQIADGKTLVTYANRSELDVLENEGNSVSSGADEIPDV